MLGLSDIPDFSSGNEPSSPTDHGGGDAPRIVRRNSRTPRRPIDSLSKEDGNLPLTGQYDSGSKDKTMIKFKPKFKENNAKSSFGLLTNKAGAGAGSDDFEGRSR